MLLAFQAAEDAFVAIDRSGWLLSANPAAAALLGRQAGDLHGQPLASLLDGDLEPPWLPNQPGPRVRHLLAAGSWLRLERLAATPSSVLDLYRLVALQPAPAAAVRAAPARTDKAREERVDEANVRLLALIEQTPDVIATATPDGRILSMNPAGRRLLGARSDEEVARWTLASHHPPGERERMRQEVIPTAIREGRWMGETTILLPGGQQIPASQVILAHRDEAGEVRYLSTTIRDLTERMRAERAAQDAQKLQSLGVLAGGIAHKFNNLLTSILGFATLAAREVNTSELVRSALRQIEESSRQAADVCVQMLAYAGKGRFLADRADLSAIVQQHAVLLELATAPGVTLDLDLPQGLPAVHVDASLVGHCVLNLLTNAVEALGGQPGRITVRTGHTRLRREELQAMGLGAELDEGDFVFLEVSDTGSGMDAATQARLFEPFFSTRFTGRGLGLPAVLGIVRSHKGAIALTSAPGQGTTVRLCFPVLVSPAPARDSAVLQGAQAWRGSGVVLVIDDDESVRGFANVVLQRKGFRVLQAGDGVGALEVVRAREADLRLVLLDLALAQRDGEGTLAELRSIAPQLPVVLMSGSSESEMDPRFADQKPNGFLQKPFTLRELEASVRAVLGAASGEQAEPTSNHTK
jgi:PAS domain S-box-containing protein